jgi:uncharacterized protein (TIGR03083 family)
MSETSKPRQLLHANDIRFVDFATGLTEIDWARQSLCTEWCNHEVLAHLVVGYRASPATVARGIARQRGSFDRANAALAAELARRKSPAELIKEFAALIDRPRGIGRVFPPRLLLGDHVIHELDIAFALTRQPRVGSTALVAVLNTQVRLPNPFVPAAAWARGLHLRATDADWAHGQGDRKVTGGAAYLASVLAGRPWALDQLSGTGVDELRGRISVR